MSNNTLGSYYVSLGMKADHDSFDKAKRAIGGVTNNVTRLIGAVRNASVIVATGLGTIANATGSLAAKDLMLAESMDMSSKSLKAWQSVARVAHTDAGAFVGKIAELNTRIWKLTKDGVADDALLESWEKLRHAAGETNAEFLKIDDKQFLNMSADDRAKTILRMGQAIKDKTDAAMYVGNLLGSAGKDITTYLHMTGKNVDMLFNDGMSRVFETEAGMQAGMRYQEAMTKTVESFKSISAESFNQLGGGLVPIFDELNSYLKDHGSEITQRITGFSNDIKTIAEVLAPIVGTSIKTAVNMLVDLTGAVSGLLTGDWDRVGENLKKFFRDFRLGIDGLLFGSEVTEQIKELDAQRDAGLITGSEYLHQKGALVSEKEQKKIRDNAAKNVKNRLGLNDDEYEMYQNIKNYVSNLRELPSHKEIKGTKVVSSYVYTSELPRDMQEFVNKYNLSNKIQNLRAGEIPDGVLKRRENYQKSLLGNEIEADNSIQDGIIRPNGQVTQVAPDDWVFALRDVGNLTNALASKNAPTIPMRSWAALLEDIQQRAMEVIPAMTVHNNANAPQHITINIKQSVESTSNEWLPQTLREQAALGVQDGMQQARDGFRRLQMMSGTL